MDQKTFNKVKVAGIVVNWIEELAPKMYPYVEFIENEDKSEGKYSIAELSGEGLEIHEIMQRKYLKWSECVLEMLQEYYPEKVDEFKAAYENALPYVTLDHKPKLPNSWKMQFEFFKYLTAQKTILSHLFAKMSTMEITEDEPEKNKVEADESAPVAVPPEMKGAIFEQAIKPVLDAEIQKMTQNERTPTRIADITKEILACRGSDIKKVRSGCERLRQICRDDASCKENMKNLEPLFNIISRL